MSGGKSTSRTNELVQNCEFFFYFLFFYFNLRDQVLDSLLLAYSISFLRGANCRAREMQRDGGSQFSTAVQHSISSTENTLRSQNDVLAVRLAPTWGRLATTARR